MAHPFGEEEQASLKSLCQVFYRCLRRGHWELARACVPALHRSPIGGDIERALTGLVTAPRLLQYNESRTPQQAAWFWSNALDICLETDNKQILLNLKNESEFCLLLQGFQSKVSQKTLKDLYELFMYSRYATKANRKETSRPPVTSGTVSFFRELLPQNPELAQTLLGFLRADDVHSTASEYNHNLLNITVDLILDLLLSLNQRHGTKAASDFAFSQTVNQIYKVLSTMRFDLDLQGSELRHLCAELFKASWVEGYISEAQVQASMLRNKNSGLLSLYSSAINENMKTCVAAQTASVSAQELTDTERAIRTFFSNSEPSSPWKKLFVYCLSTGKHFMEQILLTALTLIKAEDFSTLCELLSNELKPLRRFAILLGWTHLRSIKSARSLLRLLHDDTENFNDSLFKEFCDRLLFQVEIVEWCIAQKSKCDIKKDLLYYLNSLDSHSGLYMLHNLTNLPALNEDEVFRLFRKGLAWGNEGSMCEATDLAQQRSTVIFQAFCGLKYAIYAVCVRARKCAPCRNCHARQLDATLGDGESIKEPDDENDLSQESSDLFAQYFTKSQYYLNLLPPQLKLELVENIFSLLFASLNDMAPESPLSDSMEEVKDPSVGRPGSFGINTDKENEPDELCANARSSYLNLKHFTTGLTGFLADELVLDTFLKMLEEQVEMMTDSLQPTLSDQQSILEGVSAPITVEEFNSRVDQLSKYIFEAQWRYKVVMSNRIAESNENNSSAKSDVDCCCGSQQGNNLIPMMLSPPESLLISCILRKNYSMAHQVAEMFRLQPYPSYRELKFMECYEEVVKELAMVEKKIESQSSEAAVRKSSNSRSTLQAIGNAAAAGVVFYSISDVTDKLVALAESSAPGLKDDFWIRTASPEKVDIRNNVEELSPEAMAAFDLACTQAHFWKTCKQLLETSERHLFSTLQAKGRRTDIVMDHSDGIKGFHAVLQQMNKLINYPVLQAQTELEEKLSSLFKCSITEIFHTNYSVLREDHLVCQITLDYQLEQILVQLKTLIGSLDLKGNTVQSLLDQSTVKPQDVSTNPVRKQITLLLENLESRAQSMNMNSFTYDHINRFFTYLETLAKVIVQSLNSDSELSGDVKIGNPFILLQQKPSQLISYVVFERQVPPERLSSLLQNENLEISVEQMIVDNCCEALPFSHPRELNQAQSFACSIQELMQQCLETNFPDMNITLTRSTNDSEDTVQSKPSSPASDSCPYFLTASALNFLKKQSNVTAVLACLSAIKSQKPPKSGLSWKDLRSGKKESPLDMEAISAECDSMLSELPVLERYINVMSAPFREDLQDTDSLSSPLCGKPHAALVLLGPHCSTSSTTIIEAFQEALSKKNWTNALDIFDDYIGDTEGLEKVEDALLACAAAEEINGWKYLFAVKDATLRIRLALCYMDKWPLDSCRELLAYCLCETDVEENLKMELKNKKKEVEVYTKILSLKDNTVQSSLQDIKEECSKDPEAIIQIILKTKDYSLCEDWGLFYPIPDDLLMEVYLNHLLHLLGNKDTEKSLQLLKRIDDKHMQLAVIEKALLQEPCIFAIHFLSEYLVFHFKNDLLEKRWREIRNKYMGSKVLLALPEAAQSTYAHLIASPLLMLEQLLMNMKMDWISTTVHTLRQHVNEPDNTFSNEDIDQLLSFYAGKALDIPISFRENNDAMSRIPENSQSTELETLIPPSQADQLPSSTFVGVSDKGLRRSKSSAEFVPPEKPPTKTQWIPDDTEDTCMVCKSARFSMFNRRHHCRRCGRLVCSSCSMNKMVVEGCRENPARVCDQCHSYFSANDPKTEDDLEHLQEKPGEVSDLSEVLRLSKAAELQWFLTLNEAENEEERKEFYYDQAPSASLCSAILDLHSNRDQCGFQLIAHCCHLSKGLTNPEMDSRLLLDIMNNLLFNAKMIFVKAARTQDIALCDDYSSKVDLLTILVAEYYEAIPSLDELVRPYAVIRLRNQLLEAEYYDLAIEVSTKTGLDPSGVWHAWGMGLLQIDDLPGAREKLSRCLKPPLDPNQKNISSKPLDDVIQYLEYVSKPILLAQDDDDDFLGTLKELELTLKAPCIWPEMMQEGKLQNNPYYQECLFYLHTYGTNLGIIQFYMRQELMRDALLHLLNKECPADFFIEGIFVTSYETGMLEDLEKMLESIDPTLESWGTYLLEACKHLQQKGYYNILYEIQQFMKDNVRAAMTCIHFFSHKANNYRDLGGNQKWLVKSKDHMKIFLQEVSRINRKKSFDTFRKKLSAAEISRHINTIELQMEITKFLQRCEHLEPSEGHNKPPPTLFGNNAMIIDVACKVILGGKNVEEGFGIAFRVIQDFQLDASMVYSQVCKQLVNDKNYSEILQLVKCVSESGIADEKDCDQILLRCVEEMADLTSDDLDMLIQAMKTDEAKIKAFMACRMMRSAYLTAVKQEPAKALELVKEICQVSRNVHDGVVYGICVKWLEENYPLQYSSWIEGPHHTSHK